MIIKIDHIAYSTLDIESEIKNFEKSGYNLVFLEKNLLNLTIKKDFLHKFQSTHNLSLMTKDNSYSIELLDHGFTNNQEGFIRPYSMEKYFNKIIINTDNIEKSVDFFKLLGFSFTQIIDNMHELKFFSILNPNDFYIYLNYNEKNKYYLDDKNYNCLALITNSAQKEKEVLKNNGFKTTDIEELTVNGKNVKIFFTQRDDNEIVEIIEILRK